MYNQKLPSNSAPKIKNKNYLNPTMLVEGFIFSRLFPLTNDHKILGSSFFIIGVSHGEEETS